MGCMAGGGRGSMGKASARGADVIERGGREKGIESHLRDQRYRQVGIFRTRLVEYSLYIYADSLTSDVSFGYDP